MFHSSLSTSKEEDESSKTLGNNGPTVVHVNYIFRKGKQQKPHVEDGSLHFHFTQLVRSTPVVMEKIIVMMGISGRLKSYC
jgi:hypothetical protein